jgi:GT2 family glycosyltransferase
VDLCLRLRKAGLLIVWTPYAELFRYVSRKGKKKLSRQHAEEIERFRARWQDVLDAGDPYYNPNFSLEFEDFRLA